MFGTMIYTCSKKVNKVMFNWIPLQSLNHHKESLGPAEDLITKVTVVDDEGEKLGIYDQIRQNTSVERGYQNSVLFHKSKNFDASKSFVETDRELDVVQEEEEEKNEDAFCMFQMDLAQSACTPGNEYTGFDQSFKFTDPFGYKKRSSRINMSKNDYSMKFEHIHRFRPREIQAESWVDQDLASLYSTPRHEKWGHVQDTSTTAAVTSAHFGDTKTNSAKFIKTQIYFCSAETDVDVVKAAYESLSVGEFRCLEFERDGVPGKPEISQMEQFITSSSWVVLIYSPGFLDSKICDFQQHIAVTNAVKIGKRNVIVLLATNNIVGFVPTVLSSFPFISTTKVNWLEELRNTVSSTPSFLSHTEICDNIDHLDVRKELQDHDHKQVSAPSPWGLGKPIIPRHCAAAVMTRNRRMQLEDLHLV